MPYRRTSWRGGGSGRVYKVRDINHNDIFAAKCIDPEKATKEKLKRFKNELHFCSLENSKNIVKVIDHGLARKNNQKMPFYVMPYYEETLRHLMKRKMNPNKVLPYFSQILDGVEAAHLKKVWHRDLKPENILYDSTSDTLIVADFGIAHFGEEQLYTLVETGKHDKLANFQYAAPEQRGRNRPVDYRADIFALGLILNEMFTGDVPLGEKYKKIFALAPAFEYLDDIVEHMICQSPEQRPSSIAEIKNQLIARGNEFVSRQKLDKLRNVVIPVSEVDDPLVLNPVALTGFDWNDKTLILMLNQPVTDSWLAVFKGLGVYTLSPGMQVENFRFSGDTVYVQSEEEQVQAKIDIFNHYLNNTNSQYNARAIQAQKQRQEDERKRLTQQIKNEETRQRVLKSVKI